MTPDQIKPDGGRTITVKRVCECGNVLGDATEAELELAVAGYAMPDVRQECGCQDAAAVNPSMATAAAVLQEHSHHQWASKPGPGPNGSEIRCSCGTAIPCDGHNGTTRRMIWPLHVSAELAAAGVIPAHEALRFAAAALRAAGKDSPYRVNARTDRDENGTDAETIDGWYAAWLERQADELAPAGTPENHPVTDNALATLTRFLGGRAMLTRGAQ